MRPATPVAFRSRVLPALLMLVSSSPLLAADYWVSPGGNDAWPGTQGQPWETIQRAVSSVGPGDTVHVTNGTYLGFWTEVAGQPGLPITWRAEGSGVLVTGPPSPRPNNNCDRGSLPVDNICLFFADYNVVEGFETSGAERAGIAVRGFDTQPIVGVTIRNNRSHDNQTWGIFDAFADNILYEGNECWGSADEHGIYHSNSGDNGVIRGNVLHDNNAAGLHNNGDISAGGDGIISGMLIEDNVIYGNGASGGAAINMDGVQDSVIQNNLIYAAGASGIIGYMIDAAGPATGNLIANNTVIMDDTNGRWALKLVDGSSGCTILNNVLYRNHGFRGSISVDAASLVGLTSDYNVLVDRMSTDADNTNMTLADWRQQTGQDQNSVLIDDNPATLDAYFVNPGANDWHLEAAGPATNAGAATLAGSPAPTSDFEGDPRPQGGAFDIGADEYGTGGGAVDADFSGTPTFGPAPLSVQFTDLSTGSPTSWSWNFGDSGTSTNQNPSHTYTAPGTYDVSLTATGPGGSDSETKLGYIVVTGGSPVANFLSGRGRASQNTNQVVISTLGGGAAATWLAYSAGQWGTIVGSADVDGDATDNPLTGPGPGPVYGPQVRAFQPDGTPLAKVNFFAYGTLKYGTNVGGGALDGDTPGEMLSGAGPGAVFGPHVRGWNYDGIALSAIARINFFAYSTLKFGVNVADSDVDADAFDEILTGPGPGDVFGPQVRGFNTDGGSTTAIAKINFNAFPNGTFGANVGGGDLDGGAGEIVAGRGPAPSLPCDVAGFAFGGAVTPLAGFPILIDGAQYGARATVGDLNGDGAGDLVAGVGDSPTGSSTVSSFTWDGTTLTPLGAGTFDPFPGSFYGVIPATGYFGY